MAEKAKRSTAKDVARAAGVAPMTVSYTFSKPERVAADTRRRVLDTARQLGYRPDSTARALRSGRTGQIGVVIGEHLSYAFEDPQAAQFLAGVADVCVEQGMWMVLIPTHGPAATEQPTQDTTEAIDTEAIDVDRVVSAAVDAYVLWTTTSDDPVLAAIAATGKPAAIQGGPTHPGITRIGSDDRAAAQAVATTALESASGPARGKAGALAQPRAMILSFPFDHGRKTRVLHGSDIPEDPANVPFSVTGARLAGYREALTRRGCSWDSTIIITVEHNRRRDGHDAIRQILKDRVAVPDVVLAMSDELALGAHHALTSAARHCTITGWDGSEEGKSAGILSVSNTLRQQGQLCATAALNADTTAYELPWQILPGPSS